MFYTKEEFRKMVNLSRSTIDRFYREHPILSSERVDHGTSKLIPHSHLKYFSWESSYKEEKFKDHEIYNLERSLAIAGEGYNTVAGTLWRQNWVLFGTVEFKNKLTRLTRCKIMHELYLKVIHHFECNENIKFFYTSEALNIHDLNKSHFTIGCDFNNRYDIKEMVKDIVGEELLDLRFYNHNKGGIFDISKNGVEGIVWIANGIDLNNTIDHDVGSANNQYFDPFGLR